MKILYYTDQVYLHGGIERVLANKVNYWVKQGIETHIVTSEQRGNPPCYAMDKKVVFHDLEINYNRKISYLNPSNLRKTFKHFFKLKNTIKKINPDVVIVCNFAFDFYFIPYILPKITKIKEFHSSRHYDSILRTQNKSLFKKIYYRLNDYIESKYDYLALLTKDEKQYYKSNNTVVIPNSLTSFPNQMASLKSKKVISAGRIAPVKGFEKLIEAWKQVENKNPDWVLEIYGEGETDYINRLQMLINSLELQSKVKLCGSTNNLEEKMMNSSIYAMTSLTECFPMVLLESLSCGLPIVTFDCPNGPRNIITNGEDGILVEHNNITQFANALNKLIENSKLRLQMGTNGHENIKRLLPVYVMDIWMKLFLKSNNKQY